jgi:hypothetical protein
MAVATTRSMPGGRGTLPAEPPRREGLAGTPVMLRHARAGTIALRGPRSGKVYLFTDQAAIPVLAEDADLLERTRALERLPAPADPPR